MPLDIKDITREELYDLVWSKTKVEVAKGLGISDVAVTKIARKLAVPLPPQGYWITKRKRPRPPLPATKGPTTYRIRRSRHRANPAIDAIDPSADELIDFEKDPKNRIKVPKQLSSFHPSIESTLKILSKTEPDAYGRVNSDSSRCLDVNVVPDNLRRCLTILNTIISALKRRGHPVTVKDRQIRTTVLGEEFAISIDEPSIRIGPDLTPEEQEIQVERPWLFPSPTYQASGRLSLKIDRYAFGSEQSLTDGKYRRIEDCLNLFVIGLVKAALRRKAKRLERQRQDEMRRLQQQEHEACQLKVEEEGRRLQELEDAAAKWRRSQRLRTYIEAVRRQAATNPGLMGTEKELQGWLRWASDQADRIDPLTEEPSLSYESKYLER